MATSDEIQLVLARLQTMPSDMVVSIGGADGLKKEDMMYHVENSDETGQLIVDVYMNYLRSFKG